MFSSTGGGVCEYLQTGQLQRDVGAKCLKYHQNKQLMSFSHLSFYNTGIHTNLKDFSRKTLIMLKSFQTESVVVVVVVVVVAAAAAAVFVAVVVVIIVSLL